jgi:hypothetical protein
MPLRQTCGGSDNQILPFNNVLSLFSIEAIQRGRASALTAQSLALLQHYVCETISFFAMTQSKDNPFATMLLPVAHMDEVLMHSLLALSGAHLSHKDPANIAVSLATRKHYAKMLKGVQRAVADVEDDDFETRQRLLHVMLVACCFEVRGRAFARCGFQTIGPS